jgi:hypothetical protein
MLFNDFVTTVEVSMLAQVPDNQDLPCDRAPACQEHHEIRIFASPIVSASDEWFLSTLACILLEGCKNKRRR